MSDVPRAPLRLALSLLALSLRAVATPSASPNPHMDRGLVPGGCRACHEGHGSPGSPMLRGAQGEVCLTCHGTQATLDGMVAKGLISATAKPPLMSSVLAQAFRHPISTTAFSREQPGAVTCTSCHSPHRRSAPFSAAAARAGRKKVSTRRIGELEHELCQACHGQAGSATSDRTDMSRLISPDSRSYHPVAAPARERAPSVLAKLSGSEINCTDCHGPNGAGAPAGPHASSVQGLLRTEQVTVDGAAESEKTYALCYSCHDRKALLDPTSAFPLHAQHVVEFRTSCTTCHDSHGSVENRALIRFGDSMMTAGILPSGTTGRLAFESMAPGTGSCYLNCHGKEHGPLSYGAGVAPPPNSFPRAATPRLDVLPPRVPVAWPVPRGDVEPRLPRELIPEPK